MTLTTRIRCDSCGREEPWPAPHRYGSAETEWLPYLPKPLGPMHHACSPGCLIDAVRILGPERRADPGPWHPVP